MFLWVSRVLSPFPIVIGKTKSDSILDLFLLPQHLYSTAFASR